LPLDVPTVTVNILSQGEARRWAVQDDRLGFFVDREVYVMLPAVQATAGGRKVPVWLVLAHVLAHEAGHALLGAEHSLLGIMRSEFGTGFAQKGVSSCSGPEMPLNFVNKFDREFSTGSKEDCRK
jgi:hypothetical protein